MISIKDLIDRFASTATKGDAGLFIGSGVSVPSNGPTWQQLFHNTARDLDIEIKDTDDLALIAQYGVNANQGNRGPLIAAVREKTGQTSGPNRLHHSIRKMSVRSIWTTNYDTLIEDTFRPSEIVVRVEDADISTVGLAVDQIELIKLHGCRVRSSPPGFVITRSDYEEFAERRPALTQRLCNDLLHKSFLFIGFSYSDPDIQTVMSQAQRLVGGDTREHYMIQRRVDPSDKELVSRQLLWIDELRRVGIRCALIDEHSELGPILEEIAKKSRGRTIYPTGGHVGSSALAKDVGVALSKATPAVTLFDGQSQGIGREVIDAFVAESLKDRKDLRLRTRLFANPYSADPSMANDSSLIPTLLEWRSPLLRSCHVLLAFDGGMGTSAEVEAAFEAGCIVIPVPEAADGSAGKLLNDPKFFEPINEFCPEYLLKAKNYDVKALDVMACIAKALGE